MPILGDGRDDTLSDIHHLPHDKTPRSLTPTDPKSLKFCIVGAGVAGLFLAQCLTELGIQYDLIEASGRAGGRMYTKTFSDAPHDYYDIGAMRYPKIPLMDRTFRLFEELEVPLIPYYLSGTGNPAMYNDILGPGSDEDFDHYKISSESGGVVMDQAVRDGVTEVMRQALEPYKGPMKVDFEAGFKKLKEEADKYSTREYLRTVFEYAGQTGLDFHTIQWLETGQTSSGLFDQAFSETVIDSLDFEFDDDVDWFCIEGGTKKVTEALLKKIQTQPEMYTSVTRIALERDCFGNNDENKMLVDMVSPLGKTETREYDTVFNTTTLACAARIDLTGAELHPAQKDAIRALHYDASCKVGIRFKTAWWITRCGITQGGAASSDLPLRTCVYPSYNLEDDHSAPTVLLASYTWAQDAQRIASLISQDSPTGEGTLINLILRDLARLHAASGITYEFLCEQYQTHHAFDWYHDPYTSGAFALFGPGQFESLYPFLTRPTADSRLHFVGEASSGHHAWIVGSLDSAQRALEYAMVKFGLREIAEKIEAKWGPVGEVELSADGTAHLQVGLGYLRPEEVVKLSVQDIRA
ncbi:amine oxidase [Morchella conica CCBAS932]|uniref:Amine oxidase n=1 Tax=Morchella conica CCBAS932 TaxID=1392247 RepID=A0A3N4KGZ6_9PEZI|nr:amine oxidase [Morchella conica CCBAS932]